MPRIGQAPEGWVAGHEATQYPFEQFGVGAAQGTPSTHAPDTEHVCGVLLSQQRGWVAVHPWHAPVTHSGVVPEQVCVTH